MRNNLQKYNEIFLNVLSKDIVNYEDLRYKETAEWDSVAQITIISSIEEAFNISIDVDDIFEILSYTSGKKILKEKYDIEI